MRRKKIALYSLIILLGIPSFIHAEIATASKYGFSEGRLLIDEKDITDVQMQARIYRKQGLEEQELGNLDAAMSLYQKAIAMDSSYAIPHNDLGVIYESYGWLNRAEKSYKKAISMDPNFLSAYSNLALLYESRNQWRDAYACWEKRVELGSECDPWTKKAKENMENLVQFLPEIKQLRKEEEKRMLAEKMIIEKEKKVEQAKQELVRARNLFRKEKYKEALASIDIVFSLNPQNKEALALKDEVNAALKNIKKEENIKSIQEYFRNGMQYYRQDDLQAAKREFERIVELTASPQKI